jgi:hypothetical protein
MGEIILPRAVGFVIVVVVILCSMYTTATAVRTTPGSAVLMC